MKLYIRHAFDKSEVDTQYADVGFNLYPESASNNWVSLKGELNMASEYLDANVDKLNMDNTNMPVSFKDEFNATASDFTLLNNSYDAARQTAMAQTQAKLAANNAIYADCIAMGMDGWQFFKSSALQSQFSFEAVSSMLSPAGASSAVVTVVNANNKPLIAEVSIKGTDKAGTIDADDGKCELTQLSGGETTFIITADGYAPKEVVGMINTGTTFRLTVNMVPMFSIVTEERTELAVENGH